MGFSCNPYTEFWSLRSHMDFPPTVFICCAPVRVQCWARRDKMKSLLDDSKANTNWHVVTPEELGSGPKCPRAERSQLPTGWNVKSSSHIPVRVSCCCCCFPVLKKETRWGSNKMFIVLNCVLRSLLKIRIIHYFHLLVFNAPRRPQETTLLSYFLWHHLVLIHICICYFKRMQPRVQENNWFSSGSYSQIKSRSSGIWKISRDLDFWDPKPSTAICPTLLLITTAVTVVEIYFRPKRLDIF